MADENLPLDFDGGHVVPAIRPTSVLFGRDCDVLNVLIPVHAIAGPIIDTTHNTGVMWKGANFAPDRRFDIEPPIADVERVDCRAMPLDDSSVAVLVFDPPHLPAAAASEHSSGIERAQYGLTGEHEWMQADNIAGLFDGFLAEARRVLMPHGVVLAKLSDYVHNHQYQWMHMDFIAAVRRAGLTACDLVLKCDPAASNLKSSKWINVKHVRRGHCFWIVARKGRCERPAAAAQPCTTREADDA